MKYFPNENMINPKYTTLILGLVGFISAADNWFVSPSLPAIAAGFNASISKAGVILTAYMIPYGIIAVSLALIGDTVPTFERQFYIGKFMGIVFLGQGLSSGLGGALTKYFSWRTAFIFFTVTAICTVFFCISFKAVHLLLHTINFYHKLNKYY